jgi:5-methylcytosine-specific restriction endonuclease McrA
LQHNATAVKEGDSMALIRRAVLELNASYEALRIVSMKKALTLITKGVAVVEVPTDILIHKGLGIYAPSVIRLRHYRNVPHRMQQVSRKNIFVRDGYKCQYCGTRFANGSELELEHVIPRSRGGRNSWENLVAACRDCNRKKNNRTPEEAGMTLLHRPLPATVFTSRFVLKQLGSEVNEWGKYLFNDSEGEKKLQFN